MITGVLVSKRNLCMSSLPDTRFIKMLAQHQKGQQIMDGHPSTPEQFKHANGIRHCPTPFGVASKEWRAFIILKCDLHVYPAGLYREVIASAFAFPQRFQIVSDPASLCRIAIEQWYIASGMAKASSRRDIMLDIQKDGSRYAGQQGEFVITCTETLARRKVKESWMDVCRPQTNDHHSNRRTNVPSLLVGTGTERRNVTQRIEFERGFDNGVLSCRRRLMMSASSPAHLHVLSWSQEHLGWISPRALQTPTLSATQHRRRQSAPTRPRARPAIRFAPVHTLTQVRTLSTPQVACSTLTSCPRRSLQETALR